MNRLFYEIESGGNKVLRIENKNSLTARIILLFILSLMLALPLFGLIIFFANRNPETSEGGGLVFIAIVAWVLLLLLITRFVFWGMWGKETIRVGDSEVEVNYDYRIFKSEPQIREGELTDLGFDKDYSEDKTGRVVFFEEDEVIYTSVLKIAESDFKKLKEKLT